MLRNYFKVAFRTLWKNKGYAFINIIGLAIGISGATLFLTFVKDELSFDKMHTNYDRIVRPITIQTNVEPSRHYGANPMVLATTMEEQLPEVENQVTLYRYGNQINYTIDGQNYSDRDFFFSTPELFEVFDFELVRGDEETALVEPKSVIISESKAMALFGSLDALGEVIQTQGGDVKVTGILKDIPDNSHLFADMFFSELLPPQLMETIRSWTAFEFSSSYLLLSPDADLEALKQKTLDLAQSNLPPTVAAFVSFDLQPLADIHFNSAEIESDIARFKSDRTYITIFIFISIFLVVIAAVNYMNLATSKAVFRAKEIGIRKVVGADRRQLITQILTESLIIAFIGLFISVALTDIAMPFFNQLTGRNYDFSWMALLNYLDILLGLTLVIGLISGIYPALFMTGFKTVNILKGEQVKGGAFNIRKALVVFQFVLSTVLIISTLVVSNQMSFIRNKNLGFNEDNLLVIDINNGAVRPVFKTMKNEFAQIPGVEKVAVTSRVPGEWKNINRVGVNTIDPAGVLVDSTEAYYMSFDPDAFSTFEIKLRAGENFTGNDASDSTKIMLNQSAVEMLNLDDPVGKSLELSLNAGRGKYTVVGVMEDFNFQSLHTKIEPLIVGAWNNRASVIDYFVLKVNSSNMQEVIEAARVVHEQFDTRTVMEHHFLDEQLEIFYESDRQASVIFKVGAALSIFIACLGLFGLASFTIQKRVKELGIRKVLGASEWKIFMLLSGAFTKQILLAFLIASPIAYWIMNNWLQNFQYRVGLGFGVFLIAGLGTLLVAMLTVSYRAIRAANSNPVNSLRSE